MRRAIGDALASGVSENEILSMVATVAADAEQPELPGFEDEGLPIYTDLPDGLIDLSNAAKKYNCTPERFRRWVYRGYLEERGRLRGPGPNGGSIVVCEAELDARVASPPNRGGRPKKHIGNS